MSNTYAEILARANGPRGIAFRNDLQHPRHGTAGGYTNWLCRCARCTKANAESCRPRQTAWRRAQGVRPQAEVAAERAAQLRHGTRAMYYNRKNPCRCEECKRAVRVYQRDRRRLVAS